MSPTHVEIVRGIYARWSRGDFDDREPFAEDLEFEMDGWMIFQPEPVKATGIDGMTAAWRSVLQNWEDFRTGEIEELIEVADQVVVFTRVGGRGRESGATVDSQRAAVFTFRDGRISRLFLTGREGALRAVGLESHDAEATPRPSGEKPG